MSRRGRHDPYVRMACVDAQPAGTQCRTCSAILRSKKWPLSFGSSVPTVGPSRGCGALVAPSASQALHTEVLRAQQGATSRPRSSRTKLCARICIQLTRHLHRNPDDLLHAGFHRSTRLHIRQNYAIFTRPGLMANGYCSKQQHRTGTSSSCSDICTTVRPDGR